MYFSKNSKTHFSETFFSKPNHSLCIQDGSFQFSNNSLKSIGFHFGGRDHNTVIHSVQAVNDMIDTDIIFKKNINEINKRLSSN